MTGEIRSNFDIALGHAAEMRIAFEPGNLEEVADDNTLAEGGVYSTYGDIKGVFTAIATDINTNAESIEQAANAYAEADREGAQYSQEVG